MIVLIMKFAVYIEDVFFLKKVHSQASYLCHRAMALFSSPALYIFNNDDILQTGLEPCQ